MADRPELLGRPASEVIARHPDADADDVLLWAEAQELLWAEAQEAVLERRST